MRLPHQTDSLWLQFYQHISTAGRLFLASVIHRESMQASRDAVVVSRRFDHDAQRGQDDVLFRSLRMFFADCQEQVVRVRIMVR
ncbi:MAG: hypothetical protein DI537_35275 [Stutzerimonas stutzeri]|nr:MAG: hypothetical protein DI537_35275 [Stutzerimonas stutzeri]